MSDADSEAMSARVLRLAEEYIDRHRRGEAPTLAEYIDRHPELADRIREVFPAMAMMEDLAPADASLATGGGAPAAAPSIGPAPAIPGRLGDFRIIREVGRGGMGIVYEAEQISLGRHVALKVMHRRGEPESTELRRFRLEARLPSRLHHTNIVPIFVEGEQDGVHYYAMQFIQGRGLDHVFAELRADAESSATIDLSLSETASLLVRSLGDDDHTPPDPRTSDTGGTSTAPAPSPAPVVARAPASADRSRDRQRMAYYRSVARVGRDVAEALAYAHSRGVLHRDIKPSNLLLDADGKVWVTDFGLATAEDTDALTETGSLVGTLRYMAPERFEGQSGPGSDVYALGATLYELLTLRPIFDEPNRARLMKMVAHESPVPPREIDPGIPRDLETIVLKATAKELAHRYASAEPMAEDLRRYLEGRPILARRVGPVERLWRWSRRNPIPAASLAALFLILSFASAGMTVLWRRAEGQRRRADALLELSERRRIEAEASRLDADRHREDAEANFARARAAVDELLTRVSESHLLDVPGLQPLRIELLRSALSYYEEFVRQRADDSTLKAGLAAAQLRLAVIQRELGAEAQSEETLHKALALHETALRDRPGDPGLRAGMARCCAMLGTLGLDPVHPRMAADEALRLLERAIALWDGLARSEPRRADYLGGLANTYNLVSVLHAQHHRMAETLRAQQQAIAIRERLAADHPDDPAAQNDLASSLNNLGTLVERTSVQNLELLRIFHRAAEHGRIAHNRAPQVVLYGRFLIGTLRNIAVLERERGHFDGALRSFRESLEVTRRLSRENPALPSLRREYVQDYRSIGDLLREQGRTAEAIRLYRESMGPAAEIPRRDADDWLELAGLLGLCARPAVDPGVAPDAAERAACRRFGDSAVAALRRALDAGTVNANRVRFGDEYAALHDREDFRAVLARAEAAAGRPTTAVASSRESPRQAPPLAPGSPPAVAAVRPSKPDEHPDAPDRARLDEEQASSQHALGIVQAELDQLDEAGATLGRALATREAMVRARPGDVRRRVDLAATRAAIGRLQWRAGKLADAVRTWDAVRQVLESDLEKHPNESAIADQLAAMEMIVGHSYAEAALWEEAADSLRRAVRHGARDRSAVAFGLAGLLAVTGDRDGLKALCARMLDDYGATTEALFASDLARRCAMVPGVVPDPARLAELALQAVAAGHPHPQYRFHLALTDVRSGRFAEAVRQANAALAALPGGDREPMAALIAAVLAIAHHRLGQPLEAARQLARIERLGWDAVERWGDPQDWWRRADFLTLKREAIATVTGKPAPDDPQLHRRRGQAYARLGQPARAEAEFRAAGGP